MKKQKQSQTINLSISHLIHIIKGSLRNLIELEIHEDEKGLQFLFVMDCLAPESCLSIENDPESDEEFIDIVSSHSMIHLIDFFDSLIRVDGPDNVKYRGFSTLHIDKDNIASFIVALSEADEYWNEIDDMVEQKEELENKTKGKNVVEGNGTIN